MNDYSTVLLNKMCSPDMAFGEDVSQSEEVDDSPTPANYYNLFDVYAEEGPSLQQQIPESQAFQASPIPVSFNFSSLQTTTTAKTTCD